MVEHPPSRRPALLEVRDLAKRFGAVQALKGISFCLYPGEIVALLGPNGAGKTTTIRCIMGLNRPTAGTILVEGRPHTDPAVRMKVGLVPEIPTVYGLLTVWEHLRFVALAYRLREWESRAQRLLQELDLWDKRNSLGNALSKGMKQKVLLSMVLLHEPDVVLMDEPLTGLDPQAQREFKQYVLDLRAGGHAILMSTHMLDTVERLCDRALVLKQGTLLAEGSLDSLRARFHLPSSTPLEDIFLEATRAESTGAEEPVPASAPTQAKQPPQEPGGRKEER